MDLLVKEKKKKDDMKKTRIKCPFHLGKATLPEATWRPVKKKIVYLSHIHSTVSAFWPILCWGVVVSHCAAPRETRSRSSGVHLVQETYWILTPWYMFWTVLETGAPRKNPTQTWGEHAKLHTERLSPPRSWTPPTSLIAIYQLRAEAHYSHEHEAIDDKNNGK